MSGPSPVPAGRFHAAPALEAPALAVLDMAGTTVSDDGIVEDAFLAALGSVAGTVIDLHDPGAALAFVRRAMGRSKIEVFTELYGGDAERARRANAAFEASYDAAVDAGRVRLLPGAAEVLARLQAAGVAVCLTTGFAPATRDRVLEAVGWSEVPDLALSPTDAGRGRPWPDMILTAVLRLGIDDVHRVVVAGDTVSDLLAGWRAGAGLVIGVLGGAHGEAELRSAPHTHVVDGIGDLPGIVLGRAGEGAR